MARKKRSLGSSSSEWMNTYADMVTLLLCFFILLFTMSTVDADKWKTLVESFQNNGESNQIVIVPGDDGDDTAGNEDIPGDFAFLKDYIEDVIEENDFGGNVEIMGNDHMVFIRLTNNLLFNPNSSELRKDTIKFLDIIGDAFKKLEDEISLIRVNGHTASVTEGPGLSISDRTLSSERANAVLMYLDDYKDFAPEKLISMGYGKYYPIASNDTEEGRKKNRRVEIMVMSKNLDDQSESILYKVLSGEFDLDVYDQLMGDKK